LVSATMHHHTAMSRSDQGRTGLLQLKPLKHCHNGEPLISCRTTGTARVEPGSGPGVDKNLGPWNLHRGQTAEHTDHYTPRQRQQSVKLRDHEFNRRTKTHLPAPRAPNTREAHPQTEWDSTAATEGRNQQQRSLDPTPIRSNGRNERASAEHRQPTRHVPVLETRSSRRRHVIPSSRYTLRARSIPNGGRIPAYGRTTNLRVESWHRGITGSCETGGHTGSSTDSAIRSRDPPPTYLMWRAGTPRTATGINLIPRDERFELANPTTARSEQRTPPAIKMVDVRCDEQMSGRAEPAAHANEPSHVRTNDAHRDLSPAGKGHCFRHGE